MAEKCLILIPARFASTRFPGKPLEKICGRPLIHHVYENCQKVLDDPRFVDVAVVTDDERIEKSLKEIEAKVLRVDDPVETGSQRIALALERFYQEKIDYVLNVQGDEPLLKSDTLKKLIDFQVRRDFDIATLVEKRTDSEGFSNPNRVKAVFSKERGQCFYFSRSGIPYSSTDDWYLHLGIYSYKAQALKEFVKAPPSEYEQKESLEQLRALELGLTLGALETKEKLQGVDTPEDLKRVEEIMRESK